MGYQSAEKLNQKAKKKGLSVSRRVVREWLKTQNTYTRYKPAVRKYKFQKTFVKDLADQIQLDLVDIGKHKNKNKGHYWIPLKFLADAPLQSPSTEKTVKT